MRVDIFRLPGLEVRIKCLGRGIHDYTAKVRRVRIHGHYCQDRKTPLVEFNVDFPKSRASPICERVATVERATPGTRMEKCG